MYNVCACTGNGLILFEWKCFSRFLRRQRDVTEGEWIVVELPVGDAAMGQNQRSAHCYTIIGVYLYLSDHTLGRPWLFNKVTYAPSICVVLVSMDSIGP